MPAEPPKDIFFVGFIFKEKGSGYRIKKREFYLGFNLG